MQSVISVTFFVYHLDYRTFYPNAEVSWVAIVLVEQHSISPTIYFLYDYISRAKDSRRISLNTAHGYCCKFMNMTLNGKAARQSFSGSFYDLVSYSL